MGNKRRRERRGNRPDYWQSADYNTRAYVKNFDMLFSLAINRFRWTGLPDTCDERFLECKLHTSGLATICHPKDTPELWQSLGVGSFSDYNVYGYPVEWRAQGYGAATEYTVTNENGVIGYYSRSRMNIYNALDIFALKMTNYDRTEDINLSHQHKPWIFTAPQEKRLEIVNLMSQVMGGEPVVVGDKRLTEMVESITAINTQVPLVVEDLARAKQNVLNEALMYLGIPHLAFEKGERMIEDEARANTAPTDISLLNCLNARRDMCEQLNRRFGLDVHVYFNTDYESLNYNYLNNVEAQAQDSKDGAANGSA